jgi:hypothetical protein
MRNSKIAKLTCGMNDFKHVYLDIEGYFFENYEFIKDYEPRIMKQ